MFEADTIDPAPGPPGSGALRVAPGEVHCWCAGLELPPESLIRFHAFLSTEERHRSERLRYEADRRHFIASHGVLREILGRYLEIPPARVGYRYNVFGKPDLAAEFQSPLRFNLSHSGDLALIAIAVDSDVGVDVERIQDRSDDIEIVRSALTAAEADAWAALPADRRAEAFAIYWTRKEACLKAAGVGLAVPLIRVAAAPNADPGRDPVELHVPAHGQVPATTWSVHGLRPAPGFVGSVAFRGGDRRPMQHWWR